jgi:type II secretory pathway pseudopilin PulG
VCKRNGENGTVLCNQPMKRRAFTLFEIVIAIGLMAVVTGISVAGYRSYNRRQTVTAVARRIRQVMNEAKANATAVRMDCDICGNDGTGAATDHFCDGRNDRVFQGWRVQFILAGMGWTSGSYSWNGMCGGQAFMSSNESLPANIRIRVTSATPVLFKPGGGGTDLLANLTVNVRWGTDASTMQTVTVSRDGLVQ